MFYFKKSNVKSPKIARILGVSLLTLNLGIAAEYSLLNVSYDPTRELYRAYNQEFTAYYKEKTGDIVNISQSHGGSGAQARSVIDGSPADVVTLALAYDIDAIASKGKLPQNWQSKFPNESTPYYSTIVFLVRKGNPKNIQDWNDLIRDDVKVVTPNPKTSGGARWNHLAAYGYALRNNNNDEQKAREFLLKLYKNVPVLDTGARGSTNTFVKRNIGDVLLAWENEAHLSLEQIGRDKFDIIIPSLSILAQPPVAIVEETTQKRGTTAIAQEYLTYLYSPKAQEIIAKNYYRPTLKEVADKYQATFPPLNLLTIKDFGGWQEAQAKHFSDGGEFDKIFEAIKRER